ncbi:MAG TPA: ABC transporter permease [Saprospiraceae bacterium]|nr:ABC transporter permease [Saprospiraceae bacterium]
MNIAKIAQLEYYKFRHYRPFLVILGLFVFCFLLSGFSIKSLLDWFTEKVADDEMVSKFLGRGFPIFDFVDIWQNLAWPATIFKWIPAFVVIISVTLEYSQKTIKQNIIDGLSKKEFLLSKIALVTMISIGSAFLLFLLGLSLGLLYSPVNDFSSIIENLEFIPAYGLEVFVFLCMAMFFAFWIQKSGVTIILFLIYTACIEPIFSLIMQGEFKWNLWYLPVESINRIIRIPFPKYGFFDGHDKIFAIDVIVALGWAAIFILLSYWLLKRKDL